MQRKWVKGGMLCDAVYFGYTADAKWQYSVKPEPFSNQIQARKLSDENATNGSILNLLNSFLSLNDVVNILWVFFQQQELL